MIATRISGLAVEPWTKGEIYAVAADWAQASSPILTSIEGGWSGNGRQVADYRHRVKDALRAIVIDAIAMSEGIASEDVDDDEVDGIVASATEISIDVDGRPWHFAGRLMTAAVYTTYGSVRGQCGHVHRTEAAAEKCLAHDQAACRSQRGYSDRMVCVVDAAGCLETMDGETVWPSHGRRCGAVRAEC